MNNIKEAFDFTTALVLFVVSKRVFNDSNIKKKHVCLLNTHAFFFVTLKPFDSSYLIYFYESIFIKYMVN